MTHPLATRLASLAVMLGLFLAWEAFCRFFAINPFVLPKPSEVVMALITRFPALIPHAAQTMTTTMIGFLLGATVGVFLGVVTGISRVAYQIVSPLLVSLSSIPKVALVPIFVMWFGAGSVPAVLTAFISSVFPAVVNVATGVATTEPELEHFMKALQASRGEILWFVNLPRALPYFFASLKVAVTLAFVGTVISETVASNRGIGNVILLAASNLDVSLVFAALVLLSALDIALYAVAAILEKRFTAWAHRRDGEVFV